MLAKKCKKLISIKEARFIFADNLKRQLKKYHDLWT